MKRQVSWFLLIVLLGGVLAGVGCIGKSETPPPVSPAPKEGPSLTGIVVMSPEAEEKLQMEHWVEKEYSVKDSFTPKVGISIKNISDKALTEEDALFLIVTSLGASKHIVGKPSVIKLFFEYSGCEKLQPKEVYRVPDRFGHENFGYLFHSDETKFYRIDIRYMSSFPLDMKYVETEYAKGKFEVISYETWYSHGWGWGVTVNVKGVFDSPEKCSMGCHVCFQDASGKNLSEVTANLAWVTSGKIKRFGFIIPWGDIVQETKSFKFWITKEL